MSSFDTWVANVEAEFWKAHNEVMNATGIRKVLDTFASSSGDSGSFFAATFEECKMLVMAVNWSEPFFRYLAAFHVLIWVAVLYGTYGSVSDERLIAVCVALTVTVLVGMPLNSVGNRYASSIFVEPGVNYFTEDGMFIAVTYMAPLILLIVCLQIRMACRVVKLMVQVKRAQIRRQLRREGKPKSDAVAEPPSEGKKQQ